MFLKNCVKNCESIGQLQRTAYVYLRYIRSSIWLDGESGRVGEWQIRYVSLMMA